MNCIKPDCKRHGSFLGRFAGVDLVYCWEHDYLYWRLIESIKKHKGSLRRARDVEYKSRLRRRKRRKEEIKDGIIFG